MIVYKKYRQVCRSTWEDGGGMNSNHKQVDPVSCCDIDNIRVHLVGADTTQITISIFCNNKIFKIHGHVYITTVSDAHRKSLQLPKTGLVLLWFLSEKINGINNFSYTISLYRSLWGNQEVISFIYKPYCRGGFALFFLIRNCCTRNEITPFPSKPNILYYLETSLIYIKQYYLYYIFCIQKNGS